MNAVSAVFGDGIVVVGAVKEVEELNTKDERSALAEEMEALLLGEVLTDEGRPGIGIPAACSYAGLAGGAAVDGRRGIEIRAGIGGKARSPRQLEIVRRGEVLIRIARGLYSSRNVEPLRDLSISRTGEDGVRQAGLRGEDAREREAIQECVSPGRHGIYKVHNDAMGYIEVGAAVVVC